MKIKIFTEGGFAYGWGHLKRCIRLKKILEKHSSDIKIYYYGDDFHTQEGEFCLWPSSDVFDSLITNTDIIIIDSYKADITLYEKASRASKLLIVLDDTNRLRYPDGRILINGGLGAENLYKKTDSNLTGIKYAIIDKRFFATKKAKTNISDILITFGASDVLSITKEALDILKDKKCQKHIVLPQDSSISPVFSSENFYHNLSSSQMASLMQKCDIAISAGGGTLNELGMSQVPTLIIPIAQNQLFQSEQWQKSGSMKISSLKTLNKDFDTITPVRVRKKMIQMTSHIEFGSLLSHKLTEVIKGVMG